jgi:hypothetical protein
MAIIRQVLLQIGDAFGSRNHNGDVDFFGLSFLKQFIEHRDHRLSRCEHRIDQQQILVFDIRHRLVFDTNLKRIIVVVVVTVGRHKSVLGIVEIIQKTQMQRQARAQNRTQHELVFNLGRGFDAERRLDFDTFIMQVFAQFIRHDLANTLDVPAKAHTVVLYVDVPDLSQEMVQYAVGFG